MTTDLGERLRRANPVRADAPPDERLLQHIVSRPRGEPSSRVRRKLTRRVLVLCAVALVALGGAAAAVSTLTVQYFGASDNAPTPAAIVAAIQREAKESGTGGFFGVDPASLVRLAAFDGDHGRVTVYGAASAMNEDFCIVSAIDGQLDAGACSGPDGVGPPWGSLTGSGFGEAVVLYGRLAGNAAGIEIGFSDGSVRQASVRRPLWIYVLGRDELTPPQRPVEVVARDAGGTVLARGPLGRLSFAPPASSGG